MRDRDNKASLLRMISIAVIYLSVTSLALRIVPGVWVYKGRFVPTAVMILLETWAIGMTLVVFCIVLAWLTRNELRVPDIFIIIPSVFLGIVLTDWLIDGFTANAFARVLLTVITVVLLRVLAMIRRR